MKHSRKMSYFVTGLLITVLAACVPAVPATSVAPTTGALPNSTAAPPTAADSLAGTEWELMSFGPAGAEIQVVEGSAITLAFGMDGTVAGSGGCNSYSAQYRVQASAITFNQIVSTDRACSDTSMTQQEQRYFQALETATEFVQADDELVIRTGGDAGPLLFTPAPQAGMSE